MVLATRKGGDHMPFGVVSERYGGRILTETPPELRGARGHLICALSSWLVLGSWLVSATVLGWTTDCPHCHACHWARSLAAAPVGVTACSHWACVLHGRGDREGAGGVCQDRGLHQGPARQEGPAQGMSLVGARGALGNNATALLLLRQTTPLTYLSRTTLVQ